MRFLCPKCKAKYQIADEKLEDRAVRMKCRKCGHVIEVPSPAKKPATVRPPAPSEPRGPTPLPPPARPVGLPPRPAPARPVGPPAPARPAPLRPTPPKPAPATSKPLLIAVDEPPSEPRGPQGGLASAFAQKVREPQQSDVSAAIEVLSAGAAEEWYVGINGVPLGPVRLSTLRQKAQQGLIDEESLVWRAGFEEWLPLRTFPELLVLVRESREMVGRASYLPSPPQPHSLQPAPSRTPAPVSAAPISAAPISAAPISAAPISAAPISAALASQPGAAEFDQEPATVVASSPEGVAAMAHVTSDPFAPPKSSLAQVGDLDEGARKSLVDDIAVGVRKQVRMHPAAYVLIAIAFGFGATGAIVFFTNDRTPAPPPTIQVVTVTAPPVIAAPTEGAPAVSVAMNTEVGPGEVRTGGGTRPVTDGTKSLVEQDPPKVDGKGTAAPRVGLGNGPSIDGPSMTGPGQGPSGNLPQQLDQSDIERVVAAHRVSVRRGCWDPAIAGRSPNAPKSAKVTVSLSIGPSGNVTSASSTGGDGFPGLASCVTGRVRGWKFPPSAGTSQANIPFAFFLQ